MRPTISVVGTGPVGRALARAYAQAGARLVVREATAVTVRFEDEVTGEPIAVSSASVAIALPGGKTLFSTSFQGGFQSSIRVEIEEEGSYALTVSVPDRDPVVLRDVEVQRGKAVELRARFERR